MIESRLVVIEKLDSTDRLKQDKLLEGGMDGAHYL